MKVNIHERFPASTFKKTLVVRLQRGVIMLLLTTASSALAAIPVSQATLEERLKPFSSVTSIQAHFTQEKWLKEADVELKSSGEFRLLAPHSEKYQLTWEIKKPRPSLVKISGDKISMETGQGSDKKVRTFQMSDLGGSANKDLNSMAVWLRLKPDEILKSFEVMEEADHLIMRPHDTRGSPFEKIHIYLSVNGYLKKVELFEKSGDKLTTQFTDVKMKKDANGKK